jgi:hypothetical protein
MQDTRINRLVNVTGARLTLWLINPWRQISLTIISFLFGNFLATAISTIAGQQGYIDIGYAFICVLVIELMNWLYYRPSLVRWRSLWLDIMQGLKFGITFGLFVEAFKLGS